MDSATATEITQTITLPYVFPVTSISSLGVASDGMTTFAYFGAGGIGIDLLFESYRGLIKVL